MSAITAAMTTKGQAGFAWSPDGTKLTISSEADQAVRTFTCSTAFDPDTATLTATKTVTNPQGMQFVEDGAFFIVTAVNGDVHQKYPATDYVVNAAGALASDVDKSEAGLDGTGDGCQGFHTDGTWSYWIGEQTTTQDEYFVYETYTGGDLDLDAVGDSLDITLTGLTPSPNQILSHPSTDGLKWYFVSGGSAVLLQVTTLGDLSTFSNGSSTNLGALVGAWSPTMVWIDLGGDTGGEIQLAKFITGAES
jgi:hypothetical protein